MYVVGLRAYDQFSNPVRSIHTFVQGPFEDLEDAQKVCRKVADNVFNNYLKALPKGTSFLIKEKEEETTIYQLVNGKQSPLITVASVFFDTQKFEQSKQHISNKEKRAEACRRLASLILK